MTYQIKQASGNLDKLTITTECGCKVELSRDGSATYMPFHGVKRLHGKIYQKRVIQPIIAAAKAQGFI